MSSLRSTLLMLGLATLLPVASTELRAEASDQCARVSTFDIAPRRQKLYPAVLIAVDGSIPGPTGQSSWRLSPGRHVLTVAEAIEAHEFSALQMRERDGRISRRYKTLEIDAKPGITYRLAARFHPEQRHAIRSGDYWSPEVWKESAEACR